MSQRASHLGAEAQTTQAAVANALTTGVGVGGSSIKWVALDGTLIAEKGSVETPQTSRQGVLEVVAELVEAQPGTSAMGVALPGVFDAAQSGPVLAGGGLSSALDILTPVIGAPIRERAPVIGECLVVASSLGLHAGAIGAALWKVRTP